MADVQRPTILTVLAILAIIGGVFGVIGGIIGIIGGIAMLAVAGIKGIWLLIYCILLLALSAFQLLAAIKVMGNKAGGVNWMKIAAGASAALSIINIIITIVMGGAISWGSAIFGLAINVAIVVFLTINEDVKKYVAQVG